MKQFVLFPAKSDKSSAVLLRFVASVFKEDKSQALAIRFVFFYEKATNQKPRMGPQQKTDDSSLASLKSRTLDFIYLIKF